MNVKRFFLTIAAVLTSVIMSAVPARRDVILEQPNGVKIAAIMTGDEYSRVLTDLQGHALIQGNDGYYYYARYDASGNKASTGVRVDAKASSSILSESAAIPYSLLSEIGAQKREKVNEMRSSREPILKRMGVGSPSTKSNIGTKKGCIVIMAQYNDVPMTYTKEDIDRVFNEKGYSKNYAQGSVADYFNDQLSGECEFHFTVTDVVTLRGTRKSYGENVNGSDKNPEGLVKEACMTASRLGLCDFSQFDDDNDGQVDNVFVIFSGKDEADGGGDDCIWAHQYYLSGAGISLTLDGKKIDTYTICSEMALRYTTRQFNVATIGTLCHEYGHSFGLKDMYDVDGSYSGGSSPGFWGTGIMDTGCYLNDGNTPAHYNAVDYDTIGCGNPQELKLGETELEPISKDRKFYKIEGSVKDEYYLIECRANKGWDKYIGGKGMGIYHVDHSTNKVNGGMTAAYTWYMDAVNNNPDHMCAQMVAPITTCSNASMAFWPYENANSFSPVTTPAFKFWNGEASSFILTDITISGSNVRFKVSDAQAYLIPNISNITVDTFQTEAIVTVETDDIDFAGAAVMSYTAGGETKDATLENIGKGVLVARISDLDPCTDYKASLHLTNCDLKGDSMDANFKTKDMNLDGDPYIYISSTSKIPLVVFDASDVTDVRWYFEGSTVYAGKDLYYTPSKSGRLKASIRYSNGDHETIIKDIKVK